MNGLAIRFLVLLLALSSLALLPGAAAGQDPVAEDSLVTVVLHDGTELVGRVVAEDANGVTLVTVGGVEIRLPRASIASIRGVRGRVVNGVFQRADPNYSRLIFAPTGRPLRKGDAYFSDFYVFLPSMAYGVTDNFSIWGGLSIIPGISLTEQLFYVAPRVGGYVSENVAVSAGVLYTSVLSEDIAAGIAFSTATFGPVGKSFTAGLGLGFVQTDGRDFEFADRPILVLGGERRLSDGLAFVTENWLVLGDNFDLSEQPFTVALRFLGERIAVDLGMILIGDALSEGFPIPLVSFVYNFGPG